MHALNAYDVSKTDEQPLSVKAQPGGVNYRHWLGLAFPRDTHLLARVVHVAATSNYRKSILNQQPAILWVAGYDMDNMKARCWYESTMPVYGIDHDSTDKFGERVLVFINHASELANALRFAVKEAWFSRPKDAKGDVSFLSNSFWQNTEQDFYRLLDRMVKHIDDVNIWAECAKQWKDLISRQVYTLFDQWALSQQEDGLDMRRIVKARNELRKKVGKVHKELNNYIVIE